MLTVHAVHDVMYLIRVNLRYMYLNPLHCILPRVMHNVIQSSLYTPPYLLI